MNTATTTAAYYAFPGKAPLAARNALRLLENLHHGTLTVHLPDGSQRRFGAHPRHPGASMTLLQQYIFPGGCLPRAQARFATRRTRLA